MAPQPCTQPTHHAPPSSRQQAASVLSGAPRGRGPCVGGAGRRPPGPGPPVPGQGSASPHYLLLQNLLHPSTPNRDYRPSTVSNCSDSWIRLDPVPRHSPWPPPPGPASLGAGELEKQVFLGRETKEQGGQEDTAPTPGWPPELKEESQPGLPLSPF